MCGGSSEFHLDVGLEVKSISKHLISPRTRTCFLDFPRCLLFYIRHLLFA